jgi:hypothetical protein
MFGSGMKESRAETISLHEEDSDSFLCFLRYLYTDDVMNLTADNVVSVLKLANQYGLYKA